MDEKVSNKKERDLQESWKLKYVNVHVGNETFSEANKVTTESIAYGRDQAEDGVSRIEAKTKDIVHPDILKDKNSKIWRKDQAHKNPK